MLYSSKGAPYNAKVLVTGNDFIRSFLVFFFSKKTTYCCRTLSVRLSARLSSVEIIYFRGNLISIMPIDLKIGLNVR